MEYRWDAATYASLELPHLKWGEQLLEKFSFIGDEIVVEAGCGTGRDSGKLASLIPRGKLIAFDASDSMLEVATRTLEDKYQNIIFYKADLLSILPEIPLADLMFSVATFHWIHDHKRLFSNLTTVLKPGAVLLADCGGKGNIHNVIEVVNSILGPNDFDKIWNFADAVETKQALDEAGYEVIDVELKHDPAVFPSFDTFKVFLSTLILGRHTFEMTDSEKEIFLNDVARSLPENTVDYVRLKIHARVR